MSWITSVWLRGRALIARRQLDRDLEDELAAHLAMKQERLEREGTDPTAAALQARLALGNTAAWKEETRDAWMFAWLEGIWRDLSFAMRMLAKDRAFTVVALVTLTLGIGANTAVFTLLNGLLWRALPVEEPERLVRIGITNLPPGEQAWSNGRMAPATERMQMPFPLYSALNERKEIFDGTFGIGGDGSMVMETGGAAYKVSTSTVTGTFFPVLGVKPRIGRLLTSEDDIPGGPPSGWSVVISDGLWARLFARDPGVVGGRVTIERTPFTIAGVATEHFHGIHPGREEEVWIPLSAMEAMFPQWKWRNDRGSWMLQTVARLRPGISIEQGRQQLAALSHPLFEEVKPFELSGDEAKQFLAMKVSLKSARSGYSWVAETFGKSLWVLMAAVGAVLLIAATNLTNLLLARSTARRHEMAVRIAIGASADQIRRQVLTESFVLAAAGTACGIIVARVLTAGLLRAMSARIDTPVDWTVVGFLASVLIVVVLVAGWAPAWSASKTPIYTGAKEQAGSRSTMRLRGGLIILQIALTLTLLGGAGLLLASLRALLREPTGFGSAHSVFVTPDLFNAGVSREGMPRAYADILEETRRQPGVTAAAWTQYVPLTGSLSAFTIQVQGRADLPENQRMVFSHQVTDGYFAAAGIPLRLGRDFPAFGSNGGVTCIVSENLARKFFGSAGAVLGKHITGGSLKNAEIIGVAADSRYQHIREASPPTVYSSYWDEKKTLGMTLVVNSRGPREALMAALQAMFRRTAGRLPFIKSTTIDENVRGSVLKERMLSVLLTGFALFALMISATGIAGLLSYAVQLRRQEIGIRLALGATPAMIWRQFQRYGLVFGICGLTLGGVLSFWLRSAIDAWLFKTAAADGIVWLSAAALLLVCALAASAIPAWRAARVDPMHALRMD
jgi:predicted permease